MEPLVQHHRDERRRRQHNSHLHIHGVGVTKTTASLVPEKVKLSLSTTCSQPQTLPRMSAARPALRTPQEQRSSEL